MTFHAQAKASRATVDLELVELLECLWAAGFDTQFSCQGDRLPGPSPTPASITFGTLDDAVRFVRETMRRSHWYNRMTIQVCEPLYDSVSEGFGPVRGQVRWPVLDAYAGRCVTDELTDVWAGRQRAGDSFTRNIKYIKDVAAFSDNAVAVDPAGCSCADCCVGDAYPEDRVVVAELRREAALAACRVIDRR